ncbi:hypothetical protein J2X86_002422 [Acinetobacter lwoffii]|jgi:hypothetical protein|uniref:Uncharacterized protein n=1 Tax=Acinetobacter lwoffii TaxID=28090 RepID=A0AAW8LIK8_ACILW|nr:hypothetical protein [Acinetobacter lwoffii]
MTLHMLIALIVLLGALVALFISNKVIDTTSCKRNWAAIMTFLTCLAYLADFPGTAWFCCALLLLGIFINYAFPFLLNVLTAFNWKSDP